MISFSNLFKRKHFPRDLTDYYKLFDDKPDLGISASKATFVVLDTETTGLSKLDEIVSIGAVKVFLNEIDLINILDLKLKVEEKKEESIAIHEIINTAESDVKEDILKTLQFLGNCIIVGHHIRFDIQKMNQWISTVYPGFRLQNRTIDTATLAQRLHREEMERMVGNNHFLGLDNLCNLYQVPVENRHTAVGDALITGILLLKLLTQLNQRGVSKLSELL